LAFVPGKNQIIKNLLLLKQRLDFFLEQAKNGKGLKEKNPEKWNLERKI